MRRADASSHVWPMPWSPPDQLLRHAVVVVLSEDDLGRDATAELDLIRCCQLLVVTRGARGCTRYDCGEREDVLGFPVAEIDPTNAGDVFAAAFLLKLAEFDYQATTVARFANAAASFAVEAPGVSRLASRQQVLERMAHDVNGDHR